MPFFPPTEPTARRWSLTRRMAVTFSLITSALLVLHALSSGWFVVQEMRRSIKAFLQHETEELALAVQRTDGSDAAVAAVLSDIVRVSDDLATAFRVRRVSDNAVVAEGGDQRLLAAVPDAVPPEGSWRSHLFNDSVASDAVRAGDTFVVEVLRDASPEVRALRAYLLTAALALLGSVALAALAGWYTARRGLAGLRQVVASARDVDLVAPRRHLNLTGAPHEVAEVGSAFESMLARIDAGLRSMRTFTAGLAHELRSPLQNLVGETEVALLADRSGEAYRSVLSSNLEDLAELSDAVDNLVAWCRAAEPQGVPARREVFDLAGEARLRLQRESRSGARAGVSLKVEASGDTRLMADREACLRVVRNLVGNAITWSPSGGVILVGVHGDGDCVRLVVEDQGPGVPPEVRERLFEPFTSRPPAGRRTGYGLGLAISRGVLQDHGGTLVCDDRPGQGARFVATFPRGPVPVSAAQPAQAVLGTG